MRALRLLVVEDEFVVALELGRVLEEAGHDVCGLIGSGEEAVVAAIAHRPDCVLMDVNVRGTMGGVAAAREIRARVGSDVLFLTGLPLAEVEAQVRELDPVAVLAKPIRGEELERVLSAIAGESGGCGGSAAVAPIWDGRGASHGD